jgi:catechol 2,3-dioxygenase-like lactoylglutathione lyase family enzyme
VNVATLRQIAVPSANLPRAVQFYRDQLGAEFIAQFDPPGLAFFRLGNTRLLLEHAADAKPSGVVLYFEVTDIDQAYADLQAKGVQCIAAPHLIFRDEAGTFGPAGGEEWMAFFKDPDGNNLALASRVVPGKRT